MFPDDIGVADGDGAVLIAPALLDEVVAAASEQERLEAWIQGEVDGGAALPGLYPPNDANLYRALSAFRRELGTQPGVDCC